MDDTIDRDDDDETVLGHQPIVEKVTRPRVNRYLANLARHKYEEALTTRIMHHCPWLQKQDRILARAFSELERLARECHEFILREGIMRKGADGLQHPHPLLDKIANLRRTQVNIGRELGLTPKSRVDVERSGDNPFSAIAKRVNALPIDDEEITPA